MNASLNWLKAYVPDLDVTDREFTDAMTLSGTKVEGHTRLDKNLEKIVIGQIMEIKPHPDADKLVVCQVDIGSETLQIVTGAKNMKEGDKVAVVTDGGKVAGGHDGGPLPEDGIAIKAGKLRGVESYGMMCAIEEMGQDAHLFPRAPEDGIYIFEEDAEIGADAIEALGLHDSVFEFEVTSNRVDCYSILGIAREAAATFDKKFIPPVVELHETDEKASDYISVEVVDKDLCPRYCGRVCTDITIAESPKWMQERLRAAGIRPISNLVDITNYVMLEYGQPMHAFDLSTVAGNKIIVKRAADGDKFITLDGQERTLDHDVLMICDAEKEIGIAGIMGGENSMITDSVKTVLFEAATFNGPNIRKSAKRIGLRTDSSSFFEKGLDPANAEAAVNRACQLVEELNCGKVTQGIVEDSMPLKTPVKIPFTPERINAFLGTDIPADDMLAIFEKLELVYDKATNEVTVPTFRQDVLQMADLAEEVARFYGYDKIPTTLPRASATTGKKTFQMEIEDRARAAAFDCGFSEGYCYSFESPKVFDALMYDENAPERKAIRIANPLGEDFSIMRTVPVNGILTSLATNYNRRNKNAALFEIGNIYLAKELPLTDLPDERKQLTLGFYGDGDFYTMKGAVETFLESIGMDHDLSFTPDAGIPFLHPGRQACVSFKDDALGYLGEVHPEVCDNYEIGTRAYLAVIDIPALLAHASFDHIYQGIARFPAVPRDISMVVPRDVLAGQIEAMIRQRGGKILEALSLFDVYEGEQIKEGYKSMAYTLTFRDKERTLKDEDVSGAMKKILNGLESLGIELRS